MFMCSGQLFSHGDSARSSHTPARQRFATMWSSNSWRKCRIVVSTGFGAVCPSPHSEHSRMYAAQFVEHFQVRLRARAFRDSVQDAQRLVQSHAARNALAARLGVGELDEVPRHIHHAVVFVHHHHAARAHDRAQLRQALVIHRRVEHLVRNASARRSARLHRLDLLARSRRPHRCRR